MRKDKAPGNSRNGDFLRVSLAALCFLGSALIFAPVARAQTELGSTDDLTVLGVNGTSLDPDTEIKGFTVFGSTQAAYTGAVVGRGNVVVNGVLSVSSGAYFAGNSTFTSAGNIFINDGSGDQVLRKNAGGWLEWATVAGDNLGNHTATKPLDMLWYGIETSSDITAAHYQTAGSTVLSVLGGSWNLGLGPGAGRLYTGTYSVFIGSGAGYSQSVPTGYRNTFAGASAGYNLGDAPLASTNTILGSYAGYSSSTGGRNTFAGSYAGYSNIGGERNMFAGYSAGRGNTTGGYNTFVGGNAGYSGAATADSVFVGYNAGYSDISADNNAFVGSNAGYSSVTGGYNALLGYYAGYANTVSYNTFLGANAGRYTATGQDNAFMGANAGYSNISGFYNMFMGSNAGYSNTTNDENTYYGADAGYHNRGPDNVMVGHQAGRGAEGSSTVGDTLLVGSYAGYSLTTGSNNIFLGFKAGYNVTTGIGNIIIGHDLGASAAGAGNEINIGGVYKGDISAGTAAIPKVTVQAADSGITLTAADFGKTITVNNAAAMTVALPSVTAADIGAVVTVVKLGAGRVTVQAAAASYIANSTAGGTVYNTVASPPHGSITLRLVTAARWQIISAYGTWVLT